MKKSIVRLTLLGALLPSLSFAASTPMFNFSGGTVNFGQTFTYGFLFTPTVDIVVDGLGFFDQDSDGLSAAHRVGIWTTAGGLLASAAVATGNSTLLGPSVNGGQFRYTDIADLELTAGVSYMFGAAIEGAGDIWYAGGSNLSPSSLVNVASTGNFISGNFLFPSSNIGNRYAAGSFTAREAPNGVPEPWSLALVGLGLAGVAASRRLPRTVV